MSSPHHHHHHHHHHCNSHHYYSSCCSSSSSYCSSAASCCCCCCCCCNSSSPPPSLPPPPSNTTAAATHPLLHALANHLLLLQSPKPSPPPPPLYSYPHLKPYPSPQTHQPPSHDHHHQQQLLHSLLRRISALESSLPHLSPPPHPTPLHAHSKRSPSPKKHLFSPPPPPPPKTLQDLAARTIQTHFRLFLVRRSQTLRHLKRLASIKSHVAALRSSLSDKTHLHPAALSESAMALLLELDAIQGGDPMIREGKRSISRELTRILDFVDKVLVKEKELMEIAENAYEVIPPTRTGKKVSFFEKEKGKRSPVSSASHEPFSENRDLSRRSRRDSGENGIDGSHRQLNSGGGGGDDDDDGEEEEEEEENSSESNSESSKAKLGLSAPLPLQMEPRRLTASR